MKITPIIFIVLFVGVFFSCSTGSSTKKYVIGFSQCTNADAWRKQMLISMQGELAFHADIELLFRDAAGDNSKQVKDIQELIN
ncbi:MAG TPA: hypothetical protein VFE57_04580, partial [Cyclobacteriaceae bacterium]|nr:hypothetical protein [Cyclobacteriaceae bacterium]